MGGKMILLLAVVLGMSGTCRAETTAQAEPSSTTVINEVITLDQAQTQMDAQSMVQHQAVLIDTQENQLDGSPTLAMEPDPEGGTKASSEVEEVKTTKVYEGGATLTRNEASGSQTIFLPQEKGEGGMGGGYIHLDSQGHVTGIEAGTVSVSISGVTVTENSGKPAKVTTETIGTFTYKTEEYPSGLRVVTVRDEDGKIDLVSIAFPNGLIVIIRGDGTYSHAGSINGPGYALTLNGKDLGFNTLGGRVQGLQIETTYRRP